MNKVILINANQPNLKPMKSIILTIAVLFFTLSSFSQDFQFGWAKGIGGTSNDVAYSITTDESGNVYATGVFSGTVDFDPGASTFNLTSAGGYDVFISKLNSTGEFLWAKRLGGTGNDTGYSITTDESGNVYITGDFYGLVDFDPGSSIFNLTSVGSADIFISKFTSSGDFIWAKGIGGTSVDKGKSITIDESGNVYTTGFFQGTADFDPDSSTFNLTSGEGLDIFVSKLTSSGDFIWAKGIGGTSSVKGKSITTDESGNVYIIGDFKGTVDFDMGSNIFNLTSSGNNDVFISKLTSSGNFLWAKRLGVTDVDISMALDGSGNVYTTGYFEGTVDFDPGSSTFNLTSEGGLDIFISKLTSSGDFVWAKSIGGTSNNRSFSITTDGSGNVYTTGYFKGVVDFDPGLSTFNLTSAGGADTFISKLNSSGDFLWANSLGGASTEIGYSIVVDGIGNVYTTGYFSGIVDFDPSSSTLNLSSVGIKDIFISKIYNCDLQVSLPSLPLCSTTGEITLNATGGDGNYNYSFDNGLSFQTNPTFTYSTSGTYSVVVKDGAGCEVIHSFNISLTPTVSIEKTDVLCLGSNTGNITVNANQGSNPLQYSKDGGTTYQSSNVFSGLASGNYDIVVKDTNDCLSLMQTVSITEPQSIPVCMVTVDSLSTHNIVVWEKNESMAAIDSFKVYREETANTYLEVGTVSSTEYSTFHDYDANPNTTSYKYKLAIVDTCGGTSVYSDFHNTIHLQNLGNGNLQWTLYAIENAGNPVNYYTVLRDDENTGNFVQISSSILGADSTYTDIDYSSFPSARYRVDVSGSITCSPQKSLTTISSNIIDQSVSVNSIKESNLTNTVSIFPNPTKGSFKVTSETEPINSILIFDNLGKIVYSNSEILNSTEHSIDLSNCSEGIYTVKVVSNAKTIFSKIAIHK